MKTVFLPALVALVFLLTECNRSKINSFKPGEIWLDNNQVAINAHGGGIINFENKYYWFGQHDIEGEEGNYAQVGVHCYSSMDLYNWFDEGIALKVENDSASDITKGCILERPKVIYNEKTGKFVMWFHLEKKNQVYSSALSGIAIADHITGPYKFIMSERPEKGFWPVNATPFHKTREFTRTDLHFTGGNDLPVPVDSLNILGRDFANGQMARDMNLFVDDDGYAYHIYASEENSTLHISRLTDDYLAHSGTYIRIFPGRYMEAPAIFKINGKYYFIGSGCTGWNPNSARSAVADSILGNWTELGNPCIGADSALTFHSQSTCVFPVTGKKNAFIFMADRWVPGNAIDGRHIWLPVNIKDGRIILKWIDEWDLRYFNNRK